MKNSTTYLRTALCVCFLPVLLCAADDDDHSIRPLSIGIRVEAFPQHSFRTSVLETAASPPSYTYFGSSASRKAAVGPAVEYRFWKHISLAVEFRVHEVRYTQITQIRPDSRKLTQIFINTRSNYWEFPMLARYYGLKPKGLLAKAYVSGGLELRHVGQIRTGNEYAYPDGTGAYNEIADKPNRSNQPGIVLGVGLRLVDDFHIKLTPELRYIGWVGHTFQGIAYRSPVNQCEFGIGLSF
jgi:hypothetical protein